jgi:tetratricopeptide (TPR) repeat protein
MALVTLRSYSNALDAAIAKSRLDDHQIVCNLADENAHLYGGGPLAMPVRLLVEEEQAERAAHILDDPRPPLPEDFDPGGEPATIPATNSQVSELEKLRRMNQWIIGLLFVLLAITIYLVSELPRRTSPWSPVFQMMRQYDHKGALNLAQQISAQQPSDYYAHEVMGNIYFDMGDMEGAELEYSRAYELSPPSYLQAKLKAVRERRQREQSTKLPVAPTPAGHG